MPGTRGRTTAGRISDSRHSLQIGAGEGRGKGSPPHIRHHRHTNSNSAPSKTSVSRNGWSPEHLATPWLFRCVWHALSQWLWTMQKLSGSRPQRPLLPNSDSTNSPGTAPPTRQLAYPGPVAVGYAVGEMPASVKNSRRDCNGQLGRLHIPATKPHSEPVCDTAVGETPCQVGCRTPRNDPVREAVGL